MVGTNLTTTYHDENLTTSDKVGLRESPEFLCQACGKVGWGLLTREGEAQGKVCLASVF